MTVRTGHFLCSKVQVPENSSSLARAAMSWWVAYTFSLSHIVFNFWLLSKPKPSLNAIYCYPKSQLDLIWIQVSLTILDNYLGLSKTPIWDYFSNLRQLCETVSTKLSRSWWVLMSFGLDIPEISQSWWVLVLTSQKFLGLDESRSRHPRNFSVSMSLGLDIQEIS